MMPIQVFIVHADNSNTTITIEGTTPQFGLRITTHHQRLGSFDVTPQRFPTAKQALANALTLIQKRGPLEPGVIFKISNEVSDLLTRDEVCAVVADAGITADVEDY